MMLAVALGQHAARRVRQALGRAVAPHRLPHVAAPALQHLQTARLEVGGARLGPLVPLGAGVGVAIARARSRR